MNDDTLGDRFYVLPADVAEGHLVLRGEEVRHCRRALRKKKGDPITAVDGEGIEYQGIITGYPKAQVAVEILKTVRQRGEPYVAVTLLQAVCRDARFRYVVEKATELGVRDIIPVETARTQRGDWARKMARWQKLAIAAMKQCGRSRLPKVHPVMRLDDALDRMGQADRKYIAHPDWAAGGAVPALGKIAAKSMGPQTRTIAIAIGPEGGFTTQEIAAAGDAGFQPVHLGARRLRSETAGIVALTLVMHGQGEL